ncbi:Undefined function [Listeria monocytogenes N53-1]|nr:Undefined function [Listeria monocytogenes N53-1]
MTKPLKLVYTENGFDTGSFLSMTKRPIIHQQI